MVFRWCLLLSAQGVSLSFFSKGLSGVKQRSVGIVGCGVIGSLMARHIQRHLSAWWQVGAVCASSRDKAAALAAELSVPALEREAAIAACDLIVEATRPQVMPGIVRDCLKADVPSLVLSVGGFALDAELAADVERAGVTVHVPSGAVAGLDGVMGLREQGLDSVDLLSVKGPGSFPEGTWESGRLLGEDERADWTGLASAEARLVFDGPAREAIRLFPSNANVGISLSLAGIGFERTRVRLVADPRTPSTVHCVRAVAGETRLEAVTRPMPLADNPRSSTLAVNSALSLLRKLAHPLRIG